MSPRVALIHYWLVTIQGGERVLKEVADFFPDASVFTHACVPEVGERLLPGHVITPTWVNRFPKASTAYPALLPLMALALKSIPTSRFDLLVSFESGPAKGVTSPPGTFHACYCHTPMRYIWDLKDEYRHRVPSVLRPLFDLWGMALRSWDRSTARGVDLFVANSRNV